MLPATTGDTPSLADVLTSCEAALRAELNRLELAPVRSAVVILVDGLGMSSLTERSGHARRLVAAIPQGTGVIRAPFPTTTAAALATLTTGLPAGQHGLTGYTAIDRGNDRVVRLLSGWNSAMKPREWQPHETVFERAVRAGIDAIVVGAERYRVTGFSDAVLRGARFVSGVTIADRVAEAVRLAREPVPRLIYVYISELDKAGHAQGTTSDAWVARLDEVDAALAVLDRALPHDVGVLLTADHGMLDVAAHRRFVIGAGDPLWHGVRYVAGEPRCLQLGLTRADDARKVRDRWLDSEHERAWVVTRAEAVDAGWFGEVDAAVLPRIGDVLVAARARVAYYDERTADAKSLAMVGQHGSFSPEETRIPLARWGAFAP